MRLESIRQLHGDAEVDEPVLVLIHLHGLGGIEVKKCQELDVPGTSLWQTEELYLVPVEPNPPRSAPSRAPSSKMRCGCCSMMRNCAMRLPFSMVTSRVA